MLLIIIVVAFVTFIDVSGLALDEKLMRLLYVEEHSEDLDEDFISSEDSSDLSKVIPEVIDTESSTATEKEVLDALSKIYKE